MKLRLTPSLPDHFPFITELLECLSVFSQSAFMLFNCLPVKVSFRYGDFKRQIKKLW